ncbi:hypothetical protein VX159_14920 [Dechloromonas sp. ZY10]|uniref:hypothetical protein n=1 Tax=Dechloromonas aquae TaxID=2664436 RepID=UPI003528D8E4
MRHLLLVIVLVFAQLAVGVHAVGHAAGDDEAVPTHACELCLQAHDLGAALPTLLALPLPVLLAERAASPMSQGRLALPPPPAAQRGPPLS